MSTNSCYENWVQFDSPNHQEFKQNEEEEEALSLSDLPLNPNSTKEKSTLQDDHPQLSPEDFDFASSLAAAAALSPENQMCDADDVFFQGQILPLRHSVSSDSALLSGFKFETRNVIRSESMSVISSRSSSIRSRNSTSSGSSSSTPTTRKVDPRTIRYNYKPRIRNQFHSHPSPNPQIRTQRFRSLSRSHHKTSSLWSFLQVGVLKPPEIEFSDLKNRSRRSGSHNSSTSSSMNCAMDQNHKKVNKQRMFFGGCKCSANSVESTVKKTAKAETCAEDRPKSYGTGQGKQAVSRNRTFEWLKQLSIMESGSLD